MVFRHNVVEERLAFLQETLKELSFLQKKSKEELLKDTTHRWAVEHGLHLAAEALFDIGNHILVGHFSERAVGYDLVLNALARVDVIPLALAQRFEKLGGFRNILVHEYMAVNFNKVYERLQNSLPDFDRFITEIIHWMKKNLEIR
ncbi:MAG: DUF86 domain-containing protein [Chlamydiae bacterium]|nr:DUF86 domain-containing protein [Chlamydiota bacterium]MBI3276951.1 DUF86 domain-containing protein [Chlamydiota bacterium]